MRFPKRWDDVPLAACLLASVPFFFELVKGDRTAKFSFLAPDSFYYFTVARNISRLGQITFDQEYPTNGFHPLWQMMMAGCYWVMDHLPFQENGFIALSVLLGALCAGAGIYHIGCAAEFKRERLSVLFVLVPFGVVAFLFNRWSMRWSSVWSSVNGMETSLVLLFYGLAARQYVTRSSSPRAALWFGASLSLLTLSRLDHGIFAALMIGGLWWETMRTRNARNAIITTCVWLAILCAYVSLNHSYCGMWLPVSGSIKSTFPGITRDNFRLLSDAIHGNIPSRSLQGRAIIIFVPMLCALVYLPYAVYLQRIKRLPRYGELLVVTALGVIILGLYNTLYVPTFNIGRWYFPISTLFVSLVVLEALTSNRRFGLASRWRPWALLGASLAVVGIYVAKRDPNHGSKYARLYYEEAPRISAHYGGQIPPLVEYDDGIVAFATGAKALSGFALAIDKTAAQYIKRNRKRGRGLIDLALSRGYRRVATLTYGGAVLTKGSSDRQIRRKHKLLLNSRARAYRFRVEYISAERDFSIVVADRAK